MNVKISNESFIDSQPLRGNTKIIYALTRWEDSRRINDPTKYNKLTSWAKKTRLGLIRFRGQNALSNKNLFESKWQRCSKMVGFAWITCQNIYQQKGNDKSTLKNFQRRDATNKESRGIGLFWTYRGLALDCTESSFTMSPTTTRIFTYSRSLINKRIWQILDSINWI